MHAGNHESRPAVTVAALAGIVVLATLNYLLVARPADIRAIAPSQLTPVSGARVSLAAFPEPATITIDRSAIVARPLFRPDRRPYVPAATDDPPVAQPTDAGIGPVAASADPVPEFAPPEPAVLPPGLHLVGILNDAGRARALLRHDSAPALWYPQGGEIAGWTLTLVGADFVELNASGQTSTLKLFAAPEKTTAAADAAPAPAN